MEVGIPDLEGGRVEVVRIGNAVVETPADWLGLALVVWVLVMIGQDFVVRARRRG